jgi:spermidine/putrescine transport system permease protein
MSSRSLKAESFQDSDTSGVRWLGWAPLGWYLIFLLAPLAIVVATSFASRGLYGGIEWHFSTANFSRAFDPLYVSILLKSFVLSLGTTCACFALGFPVAYSMATASRRMRNVLIMLLAIPFLTNLVIRICALKAFTSFDGPLATVLTWIHVGFDPYLLSQNGYLVAFGMVSTYLPFMVFPLYASLERFDFTLVEAAEDLGATFLQICSRVVIPSLKGAMLSGVLLVFIPAMGEFLIPDLLGGAKVMLAGNLVSEQFLKARDWPFGSALSALLMLLLSIVVIIVRRLEKRAK